MPALQKVYYPGKIGITGNDSGRVVMSAHCIHLISSQTEQEKVLRAHFFADLDVRTIQSTYGDRAVHHELHVACSRSFLARGGYLLGQICSRTDHLHRRNTIVG